MDQIKGLWSPAALSNSSITGCLRKRTDWASVCNPFTTLCVLLQVAQGISWTGYNFCPLSNFQWIFSFKFLPRPSRRHWHPHIPWQWVPRVCCLLRDEQILLIQEGFVAFSFFHKWSWFTFSVPLMMLLTQVGNCWLCAAGWWQREVTQFSLRLSSKWAQLV